MKFKVKKPFSWAHRGVEIVNYATGEEIETDDADLIDVATSEQWIEKVVTNPEPISNKAHKSPGKKPTLLEKAKEFLK